MWINLLDGSFFPLMEGLQASAMSLLFQPIQLLFLDSAFEANEVEQVLTATVREDRAME